MKKYLIFFLLVIYGASLFAQSDIKIMSYNLLIYPEGEMVNRIDTLSKILDFYEPDLLLVQELKSEQGLQSIAEELSALFGDYKAGTYVPQVSNPANSWRLQQNLVFNEAVLNWSVKRPLRRLTEMSTIFNYGYWRKMERHQQSCCILMSRI